MGGRTSRSSHLIRLPVARTLLSSSEQRFYSGPPRTRPRNLLRDLRFSVFTIMLWSAISKRPMAAWPTATAVSLPFPFSRILFDGISHC